MKSVKLTAAEISQIESWLVSHGVDLSSEVDRGLAWGDPKFVWEDFESLNETMPSEEILIEPSDDYYGIAKHRSDDTWLVLHKAGKNMFIVTDMEMSAKSCFSTLDSALNALS